MQDVYTSLAPEHEDNIDDLTCPSCGGPEFTSTLAGDWHSPHRDDSFRTGGAYPYFNRGLGCIVTSEKHLKEVARAKGLSPIEGDMDLETIWSRRFGKDEDKYQGWLDLEKKYQTDPKYKEAYYKAVGEGYFAKPPGFDGS